MRLSRRLSAEELAKGGKGDPPSPEAGGCLGLSRAQSGPAMRDGYPAPGAFAATSGKPAQTRPLKALNVSKAHQGLPDPPGA